jgi:hypothetical protein
MKGLVTAIDLAGVENSYRIVEVEHREPLRGAAPQVPSRDHRRTRQPDRHPLVSILETESREAAVERTIVANFDTRRDAETAVEHLVQEHGIERADIFIRAPGTANTAGTRAAGADVESGHPGVETHGKPELSGPIEVSVECDAGQTKMVRSALEKAGATQLRAE